MRKFITCFILSIAFFEHVQAEVRVYTEQAPPFTMKENGKVTGMATDVVRQIMNDSGVPYTLELTSWSQAYNAALEEKDACTYLMAQTQERMPLFEWVGPLQHSDWWLLAKSDAKFTLNSLEDAKPYRIGVYRNDAKAVFLKNNGFKVDEATVDEHNIQKLLEGHIDLWAVGHKVYPYLLQKNGIKDDLKPMLKFNKSYTYMACNKNIDAKILAKIRAAVKPFE